jgi:hypothetical protein
MGFSFVAGDYSGTAVSLTVSVSPGGSITSGQSILFSATGYWTSNGTSPGTAAFTANIGGTVYNATVSPSSPAVITPAQVGSAASGAIWMAYLLNAPTGVFNTATVTISGPSADFNLDMLLIQVISSTSTAIFDTDAAAEVISSTATPMQLPTITPGYIGDYLYGIAFSGNGDTSTDATGSPSPWTRGNNDPTEGIADFYIASSSSGTTTANWPDTVNPDVWVGLIMSFYISGSASNSSGYFSRRWVSV